VIDWVLARHYVKQSALLWSGCAICLFAFAWLRVWVVSLLDTNRFRTILEQFREYERFSPVPFDQLFTYLGRIGATFDEPMVILCIVIWAVARGSDVVSGELNRGTMEMLLAQPISRVRLLLTHAMVASWGLVGLCLVLWLGIFLGVQTNTVREVPPPPALRIPVVNLWLTAPADESQAVEVPLRQRVEPVLFAASTWNLFAFGFFLLGFSSCLSAADRYRWRTIGLVIAFYILQTVLFGLGKAQPWLSWLLRTTFLSLYQPQKLSLAAADDRMAPWRLWTVDGPGLAWYPLGLLLLGIAGFLIAAVIFHRRDLPAPL
jgi:ABC-2 type transport system permease protein